MISVLPKAEGWTVECTACSSTAVPAGVIGTRFASEVPGCVHYDLMRAGVIGPVDQGDGEAQQVWVGHADWLWRGTIEVSAELLAEDCCELVFASLDTSPRSLSMELKLGLLQISLCSTDLPRSGHFVLE